MSDFYHPQFLCTYSFYRIVLYMSFKTSLTIYTVTKNARGTLRFEGHLFPCYFQKQNKTKHKNQNQTTTWQELRCVKVSFLGQCLKNQSKVKMI